MTQRKFGFSWSCKRAFGISGLRGRVARRIGDWINFGERKYNDRYLVAKAETGFTYESLQNIAWVSRKFNGSHPGESIEGLATRHEYPTTWWKACHLQFAIWEGMFLCLDRPLKAAKISSDNVSYHN